MGLHQDRGPVVSRHGIDRVPIHNDCVGGRLSDLSIKRGGVLRPSEVFAPVYSLLIVVVRECPERDDATEFGLKGVDAPPPDIWG